MNIKFLIENKTARKATLIFTTLVLLTNILGVLFITHIPPENTPLIIVTAAIMIICTIATYITIKWINNKIHWYESMLDSIPFPISVTDSNMNWTFVNRPVEQDA